MSGAARREDERRGDFPWWSSLLSWPGRIVVGITNPQFQRYATNADLKTAGPGGGK